MPIKFDYISDVKMVFPESIIIEIRGQYAYIHNDDAVIISRICGARLNEGKIPYIWLYENELEKYILGNLRRKSISYIIVRDGNIINSSFFHAPYSNAINMFHASFSKATKPKPQPVVPTVFKQEETKPAADNQNQEPSENKSKIRSYFKEPSIPVDESKNDSQLKSESPSAKEKRKELPGLARSNETIKSEVEKTKESNRHRYVSRNLSIEPPTEEKEKKCNNCKLFRRGECFGEKEICEHFDVAPGTFSIMW